MLAIGVLSLALASAAYAAPTVVKHSTASWCTGLGGGAFDTAYNFTLAAYNTTSSNTNSTGVPLVLGQAGTSEQMASMVLSTYASYPYNDFPNFSLLQGALTPNAEATNGSVSAADTSVDAGNEPTFMVSSGTVPSAAQVYCAVADTDPEQSGQLPILAVNRETDQFSLCTSGTQTNVVYRASSNNESSYDYDSCYPVAIHVVGLN
ncbi:hypothetical protein POSPLADRAFT_1074264 [Postia placenta MAD-698-R-SB12]|uniref:Uncharacterized protein n=1 Tax=Postia placenta MAD-698-R-SB12 TaxID=670580 RepID=A0A1X6N2K7_9APHY|nr:hypothetical protein POSPLADRAFT_1074264 [Postia placenta MAD-698-R-SB12]OSX62855.1 hypothetical protein POSPLADRAFT_1074264 [Postia placenta MAD-698-R-SB12]